MELGVHRHGDEPGVPAGEEHLVILGAVLHRQGDAIARLQVQLVAQTCREARHALGEAAVGAHEMLAERDRRRVRL